MRIVVLTIIMVVSLGASAGSEPVKVLKTSDWLMFCMQSEASKQELPDGCTAFLWGALTGFISGEVGEHEDPARKPPFCISHEESFDEVARVILDRIATINKDLGDYNAATVIAKVAEAQYPCGEARSS